MPRSISDRFSNGLDAAVTPIVPPSGSGGGLINSGMSRGQTLGPVSVDLGHYVLDLGVVLQGIAGEILAVAGLLVAAVRHLADQRDVVVDPDGAELQLARRVQRAADVSCPDGRGEAVVDVIRPFD